MPPTSAAPIRVPQLAPPRAPAYVPVLLPRLLGAPDAALAARAAELDRRQWDPFVPSEELAALRLELALIRALQADRRDRAS